MKELIYGYARVSTMKQSLERQLYNIKQQYPDAIIVDEAYTGTKIDRPAFTKLMQQVKREAAKGHKVTLVFDEVSRMSRDADEGFALYRELYALDVEIVFLKEPHINTAVYREALQKRITEINTSDAAVDKLMNSIITALNDYQMDIARRQIELAFEQAEKEVEYLHKRTSEGVRRAQAAGKQVGRAPGHIEGIDFQQTKKAQAAKEIMRQHCKEFGGVLADIEVMKLTGVARNSYYKYKNQIRQEMMLDR